MPAHPERPNFRRARQVLERDILTQLTLDAYAGVTYPVPAELRRKWGVRGALNLGSISRYRREEFARELANFHARTGTARWEQDIRHSAKQKRGEAA